MIKSGPTSSVKTFPPNTNNTIQNIQHQLSEVILTNKQEKTLTPAIIDDDTCSVSHVYDGTTILITPSAQNICENGLTLNLSIADVINNTIYNQDILFDCEHKNGVVATVVINGVYNPVIFSGYSNPEVHNFVNNFTAMSQTVQMVRGDGSWKFILSVTNGY